MATSEGVLSHRWIDLCERFGPDVTVVEVTWGDAQPSERKKEILKADTHHKIRVVLARHNETATGVASDIAPISEAIDCAKNNPAKLLIDGVNSIWSIDSCIEGRGVDVALSRSQKGFMLPAVFAIVSIWQKAIPAPETARLPRTYFDFRDMITVCNAISCP